MFNDINLESLIFGHLKNFYFFTFIALYFLFLTSVIWGPHTALQIIKGSPIWHAAQDCPRDRVTSFFLSF